MSDPDHLLCLTTSASGDEVFLHADAAGLDRLLRSLTSLRDKLAQNQSDHDHLKTPEWAGDELSTAPSLNSERAVQHFKIWAWTPDITAPNSRGHRGFFEWKLSSSAAVGEFIPFGVQDAIYPKEPH